MVGDEFSPEGECGLCGTIDPWVQVDCEDDEHEWHAVCSNCGYCVD